MSNPFQTQFQQRLETALDALGLQADHVHVPALLGYLQQLQHWNKAYNLTAVRDPGKMLVQHVFDSLAIVPVLRARSAGPCLACRRYGLGCRFTGYHSGHLSAGLVRGLRRCRRQKTAFIRQAAGVLGLKNVRADHGRIESMDSLQADLVISRAFASLLDFVRVAAHHRAPGGTMLAMKGQDPIAERTALHADTGWSVKRTIALNVPEMDAHRCLLELDPTGPEGTS